MHSDKILTLLEKQLRVMGKKIRIDILKRLDYSQKPLSFSTLNKLILQDNQNSVNLSFHLNSLKEIELIDSDEKGYFLTPLGKKMLIALASIEHIINEENKTLMIRTSKYSKEPFDLSNVEDYLQREGEMAPFLAKKIAKIVKNRLFNTNIEYLTTPLMREYINAILLEEGLEQVRHRLTRLGTPPFDTRKLYDNSDLNPDNFIFKLGSEVSEQFLLLNLLPNDLADLYLSGQIILMNLNYWALKPLAILIPGRSIFNFINSKYEVNSNGGFDTPLKSSIIEEMNILLALISEFISKDIIIDKFDNYFLDIVKIKKKKCNSFLFPSLNCSKFPNSYFPTRPNLSFGFSFEDFFNESHSLSELKELLDYFFKVKNLNNQKTSFLLNYRNLNFEQLLEVVSNNNFQLDTFKNVIFQDEPSQFLSSTLVNLKEKDE
ncbi:MAG: hypothetical protein EU550_04060, partial [Promethearchaeota archaeon]